MSANPALALLALLFSLPLYFAVGQDSGMKRTWEEVARLHFQRYPAMEAADLYKLVVQGVSGPRHLLADPEAARRYLDRELAGTKAGEGLFCEPLSPGGAMLRVHLAPFKACGLSAADLFAAISESAVEVIGGSEEFAAAWRRMIRLAERGRIPVAAAELKRLAAVPFDPLAWTHHSAAFVHLYRPHYRVVTRKAFLRHFPGIDLMKVK